jgi:HKD family nuclease
MFTNTLEKFDDEFSLNLRSCKDIYILTGYVGLTKIKEYEKDLVKIGQKGDCKILFGMLFADGVSKYKDKYLREIDRKLRKDKKNNGIYISKHKYHGKIYMFRNKENEEKIYIGSSNFSDQGFNQNYEMNIQVQDLKTKNKIKNFILDFFEDDNVDLLKDLKLKIVESRSKRTPKREGEKVKGKTKSKTDSHKVLSDFIISSREFPKRKHSSIVKIKIRPEDQSNSSINVCFSFSKNRPRPWYEVDITSNSLERAHPDYPIGVFTTYYKDGDYYYKFNMATQSDNNKRIAVKGNGKILGEILKGALENKGVLERNERVTSKTLELYGNDTLKLKKIGNKEYILEF